MTGKKYVVMKAKIVHHLPLISRSSLQILLNAVQNFTTKGEIWDLKRWSAEWNHESTTLMSSTGTTLLQRPRPITNINSAEDAQATFSALELPQEGLLNSSDNAEETFQLATPNETMEKATEKKF